MMLESSASSEKSGISQPASYGKPFLRSAVPKEGGMRPNWFESTSGSGAAPDRQTGNRNATFCIGKTNAPITKCAPGIILA